MAKKDIRLILETERTSKEYAENYFNAECSMKGLFALDAKILNSIIKKGKVLDAMMGPGRHVVEFARRGIEVHGNDFNRHMVEVAMRSLKKEGLKAVLTNNDVRCLPVKSGSFDYVICMYNALGSIMGGAERQQALNEMARVCKAGGLVIVHAHNILGDLTDLESASHLLEASFFRKKGFEFGDLLARDKYLGETYQHIFTPREVERMFRKAGLRATKRYFLRGPKQSRITAGPLKIILSGGFIVAGEKAQAELTSSAHHKKYQKQALLSWQRRSLPLFLSISFRCGLCAAQAGSRIP